MIFIKNKEKVRILYHQNADVADWQRDLAEADVYWSIRRNSGGRNFIIYQWEFPKMHGWDLEKWS